MVPRQSAFASIDPATTQYLGTLSRHAVSATTHCLGNSTSINTLSQHTVSATSHCLSTLSQHTASAHCVGTLARHCLGSNTQHQHTVSSHPLGNITMSQHTVSSQSLGNNTMSQHPVSAHCLGNHTLSGQERLQQHTVSAHLSRSPFACPAEACEAIITPRPPPDNLNRMFASSGVRAPPTIVLTSANTEVTTAPVTY